MLRMIQSGSLFLMIAYSLTYAVEPIDVVARHLQAGEFAAAKQIANQLPNQPARDAALAGVVRAQHRDGQVAAASQTMRSIQLPEYRQPENAPMGPTSQGPAAARGGGGLADFDSLMQLIQTTISPDTWEALGGPSTMAPYFQGIVVDHQGLVKEVQVADAGDRLSDLNQLLAKPGTVSRLDSDAMAWRAPSHLRVVSLRRLRDEISRRELAGIPLAESMYYLAGISEASYLAFTGDDVLLAAPVGGILSHKGYLVDTQSGRHPLRLDFLATATQAIFNEHIFGCTIDPTHDGLLRAQQIASDVQADRTPIGAAAKSLAVALGRQQIDVFGTSGQTTLGMMMVEADRHMKQLALGTDEMPDGVRNYLDFVDQMIASGPPADVLIRLWFTPNPQTIQADSRQQVFRMSGQPLRLSGQNERETMAARQRVADDPRTVAFVNEFNEHFEEVRNKYPVYGALESLYRVAAVAQVVKRYAPDDSMRELLESLVMIETFASDWRPTPKFVDSITKLHRVRHGKIQHHILIASGGVLVDVSQTVVTKPETYQTLASVMPKIQSSPTVIQQWWWDADVVPENGRK